MRYVVLKTLKREFSTLLRASEFVGGGIISMKELSSHTVDALPALIEVDDATAQAIDRAIGHCISFAAPYASIDARARSQRVDFDTSLLRELMNSTGMTVETASVLFGCRREWMHRALIDRGVVSIAMCNAELLHYVIQSNSTPRYAEGDAPMPTEDASKMRRLSRRCAVHRVIDVSRIKFRGDRVATWQKILAMVVCLSRDGQYYVSEPELIVELWKAWPQSFGLKDYQSQYPEGRLTRSKLVSSPLNKWVERVMVGFWSVNLAGVSYAKRHGFSVERSTRTVVESWSSRCAAVAIDKRCRSKHERNQDILPSLVAIQRAHTANMVSAQRRVDHSPRRLSPFIEAAKQKAANK